MSEIKDLFNKELDDTHLGVQGYLSALTDLIERYANEAYKILVYILLYDMIFIYLLERTKY